MSLHLNFDGGLQHPHFAVYEAGKMLHFVQDGFNVKLNSWSQPFDAFCLCKQKTIETGEISNFLFWSAKRTRAPVETDPRRNNGCDSS